MKYGLALAVALVLNASANVLMKLGMKRLADEGGVLREGVGGAFRAVVGNASLMVGLCFFALNVVFYMYALQSKALKISLAYPIMVGGGFALICLTAYLHPALAERLTVRQWVGVALVFGGIALIASGIEPDAAG